MPKTGTLVIAEPTDLKTLQAQIDEQLLDIASRELGVPRDQLVVRDARPDEDFGLSTPEWTVTPAAAGWVTYINKTIDDNKFVAIYGVAAVDADNVTFIRFSSGAKTLDYWDISQVQAFQDKYKLALTPIFVRQNTQIKIELYATSTDAIKLPLYARVVEVKGKTIAP